MKNSAVPQAPKRLSREAKGWWAKFAGEWDLDDAARLILQTALESFDRMRRAQALITKHGELFEDRFGGLKPNPACTVERDARAALLSGLKALHLDIEPLNAAPGRPSSFKAMK